MSLDVRNIFYFHLVGYVIILVLFKASPVYLTMLGIILTSLLLIINGFNLINNDLLLKSEISIVLYYFLFILSFILTIFVSKDFMLITVLMVLLYKIYFDIVDIQPNDFVKTINIIYFAYLFLSMLAYWNIISYPNGTTSEVIGFKETLLGIKGVVGYTGGSPANLDTFSVVISLINIIFYRNIVSLFVIIFSILVALATGSMTALVIMIVTSLIYLFIRNRTIAFFVIAFYTIFNVYLLFLISENTRIYLFGESLDDLLTVATHGRSVIWEEMWERMLRTYEWNDYLFGIANFQNVMSVPIWWSSGHTSNSHNSFLNLFFRFPFLFIVFYSYMIYALVKFFDYRVFSIAMLLFIGSLSNVEIFSQQNPIYIIVLTYLMSLYSNKQESILSS